MAKIVGAIDDRGRPVIRIRGVEDDLLVMVDTGFNGDLMVSATGARLLGLVSTLATTAIELGDGSKTQVSVARANIDWLSEPRLVRVFVSNVWKPMVDDPVGVIGTGLLSPNLLLIDYSERTVEIETVS